MPDLELKTQGDDSFVYGANSFLLPSKLGDGQYVMGMNVVNRGGFAYTRPGSKSLPFDVGGNNIQGLTFFKPMTGPTQLVFMVDGKVYYSPFPFREHFQITTLAFSKYSKHAAWANCVQTTDYTGNGIIYVLDRAKPVLIIQDGATRAGMWDGTIGRHLNPTSSESETTRHDRDETPIGLWMRWSNNRLWVSSENKILASDIGNPLKFTEAQYIAEGRAFYLSGRCTGIAETSDQQGIIAFTANNGTFIQSSIQDRTKWLSTPDFQKTVLPNTGCIAPRSIVLQHGLIWWVTNKGLINLDDALRQNVSSRLDVQDQEMASSWAFVNKDRTNCAGVSYENFLLMAVPFGDKYNTRVHVLDQAPLDNEQVNSWPSYWMGWRPVEFAREVINGVEYCYCISADYDGQTRIWRLFTNDRTDNGVPITCYVETRTHLFESRDYKAFRYAEAEFLGVSGDVGVMIAAAGIRGGYQKMGTKDLSATVGQIYHDVQYGEDANDIFAPTKSQSRIIRTVDENGASEGNSECVESESNGLKDRGFSLLIVWSGVAGLSCYRIFAQYEPTLNQGVCEEDETGDIRLVTIDGVGSRDEITNIPPFERFYATATFSRIHPDTGLPISAIINQSSIISQQDANRKASQTAKWYVLTQTGEI
jgi:hypothetical protein